jgi:hypothetical protein
VNRVPGDVSFSGSAGSLVESFTRPNSSFGQITFVNNANQAAYNAMILSLRGKAGHRGNFQASYTLSHAKDYPEANTRLTRTVRTEVRTSQIRTLISTTTVTQTTTYGSGFRSQACTRSQD